MLLIPWHSFAGHFLLTNLLLDKMKHTARVTGIEGRIVNLSSIVHVHTYKEGIKFDKINDQLRLVFFIRCKYIGIKFIVLYNLLL